MKLPAFTILDTLIGMSISAAVIAFGMQAYDMLRQGIDKLRAAEEVIASKNEVMFLLARDGERAQRITEAPDRLYFYFSDHTVSYHRQNGFLVRSDGGGSDTLPPAGSITWHAAENSTGLVSSLTLTWNDGWTWTFRKEYHADPLITGHGR